MRNFLLLILGVCALNTAAFASEPSKLSIETDTVFILEKTELANFAQVINKSKSASDQAITCTQGVEYAITGHNFKTAATCIVKGADGSLKIENVCSNAMVGQIESEAVDLVSKDSSLLKFASEKCGG